MPSRPLACPTSAASAPLRRPAFTLLTIESSATASLADAPFHPAHNAPVLSSRSPRYARPRIGARYGLPAAGRLALPPSSPPSFAPAHRPSIRLPPCARRTSGPQRRSTPVNRNSAASAKHEPRRGRSLGRGKMSRRLATSPLPQPKRQILCRYEGTPVVSICYSRISGAVFSGGTSFS